MAMAATEWDRAIGRRLQRLREARHWSMAELATHCSGARVTASQINKLEKGRQQFNAQWLYRLATALKCPLDELMHDRPIGIPADEQALLGRIRELAESDRRAIERIVDTMSQASDDDEEPR